MDILDGVINLIMEVVNNIVKWIDAIIGTFISGSNQYVVLAVILYIVGVFGTAKLRLNVKAGGK